MRLRGHDNLMVAGDTEAILDEVEEFLTGARQVRAPDRVLATVMFTDIVDSTGAGGGDGGLRAGGICWSVMTIWCVGKLDYWYRGREVKTTGDGFLATFDGPARAIRCAGDIAYAVGRWG